MNRCPGLGHEHQIERVFPLATKQLALLGLVAPMLSQYRDEIGIKHENALARLRLGALEHKYLPTISAIHPPKLAADSQQAAIKVYILPRQAE